MTKKEGEVRTTLGDFIPILKACSMCEGQCSNIGRLLYPGSLRYGHQKQENCCHCRIAEDEKCELCRKRKAKAEKTVAEILNEVRSIKTYGSRPRQTRLY